MRSGVSLCFLFWLLYFGVSVNHDEIGFQKKLNLEKKIFKSNLKNMCNYIFLPRNLTFRIIFYHTVLSVVPVFYMYKLDLCVSSPLID